MKFSFVGTAGWVLLTSVAVALFPIEAAAQPGPARPSPEASEQFERGTAAFAEGNYADAAAAFRAAYALTDHPDMLFNIYSALERLGDLEPAAEALEQYLVRAAVPPDERTAMVRRLERLWERIAANGAGTNADEQTPPPASNRGPHPAGIGVTVAAGVLLVNFGVFATLSTVEDGNLANSCGTNCAREDVSALEAYNIVADVSLVTGAVAAVVGIVLLLALGEDAPEERAMLVPWATPDAVGLATGGHF